MDLSGFENYFSLQINVSRTQKPLTDVGIHGPDGHIQFRVIHKDLIGRLTLIDQGRDDLILFPELVFGHVDTGAGVPELFSVLSVGEPGIIGILMSDGAFADVFGAAIADIGGMVEPVAAFLFEVLAGPVAGGTGSALDTTDEDFLAYICLLAVIAVYAEVVGIVKGAFVVPVGASVGADFL